jgi:hypothetical protein
LSIDYLLVPTSWQEGKAVSFSSRASDGTDEPLTYTWNFGDGSSASGADLREPSHVFVANTTSTPFTVTLTVSNATDTVSLTRDITIEDVAPTVDAGPGATIHAGDSVTFQGAASDAGGLGTISSVQWDFNYNGTTFNADSSANGLLAPSHTFAMPGLYLVALQATDAGGNTSLGVTAVLVKEANALLVRAGPNQDVTVGQSVGFAGSYSFPGGTVASSGIAWDFNYNGSTFVPTVTGTLTPTHTFSLPGTYQVALRITGSDGSSDLSVLEVNAAYNYAGPSVNAGTDQTANQGSGTVLLNGTISIGPNQYYASTGVLGSVQLTLQTSGVAYNLFTNGNFTRIDAAAGVSAVQLNVHTDVSGTTFVAGLTPAPGSSMAMPPLPFYGHGDVGDIVLPAGSSTAGVSRLSVNSRGDLGSVTGPSGTGKLWAEATSLFFGSLSGSLTGLDHIQMLQARGWLGDSVSDQVTVNAGIDMLSAFGVAATVTADRNYDQSDPSSIVSVGHGGVSGVLSLGNVMGLTLSGAVNQVKVGRLMGDFLHTGPGDVALLALAAVQAQAGGNDIKLQDVNKLGDHTDVVMAEVGRGENFKYGKINVGGTLKLDVKGSLAVTNDIQAGKITRLNLSKGLTARNILVTKEGIEGDGIDVDKDLTVNKIESAKGITTIEVGGTLTANGILALDGNIDSIVTRQGNLAASVRATALNAGVVKSISVGKDFVLPPDSLVRNSAGTPFLVSARQVQVIEVKGSLGTALGRGRVNAEQFGQIKVGTGEKGGDLNAMVSTTWFGIDQVKVNGTLRGEVKAEGGDIGLVEVKELTGKVLALRRSKTDNSGGSLGRFEAEKASGTIRADNYLGSVKLTGTAMSTVLIYAQAGAKFDTDNKIERDGQENVKRNALQFETKAVFAGTLQFTYGDAKRDFRVAFKDGDALLSFKRGAVQSSSWTIKGTDPAETTVNLANVSFSTNMADNRKFLTPNTKRVFTKPGTETETLKWDTNPPPP